MRRITGIALVSLVAACGGAGSFDPSSAGPAQNAPAASPSGGAAPGGGGSSGAPGSNAPGGELALAADLPSQCGSSEIYRIERPVATNDASKGRYAYAYRYQAPLVPGAPTLVFLPGGPGETSTDMPLPDTVVIPAGWGALMTDPRGVGCNTLAAVPAADVSSAFFRTDEIARDVIAALEDRKLDKYVLYGVSYGSMLATTVAHLLQAQGGPAPLAVVLEGVVGRAAGHTDQDFTGAGFIAEWSIVRAGLPSDVRATLDADPAPYGVTPGEWTNALQLFLDASPPITGTLLSTLSSPPLVRDQVVTQIKNAGAPLTFPGETAGELLRQVGCREIADTLPKSGGLGVAFSHGQIVRDTANEGTLCTGLTLSAPYDSAQLQFDYPLTYFIGDQDPAAGLGQGTYHYDHHLGHATRVVTHGGGHLSLEITQAPCSRAALVAIAEGGAQLSAVLATCPNQVTIDQK